MMTVYELIQELAKFDANTDIEFTAGLNATEIDTEDINLSRDGIVIPERDVEFNFDAITQERFIKPVVIKLAEV